jgi:hypothetical protein
MMKTKMIRNRALAAVAAMAITAVAAPAALGDQQTPRANGEGVDHFGLAFDFHAHNPADPHGHAFFETASFGDAEGDVDCLEIRGRRAALSGELSAPGPSGLTHFMVIANDRRDLHGETRDRTTTWLRNGPFDCATDGFGDLSESLKKIESGEVKVVPAGALPKTAKAARAAPSAPAGAVNAAE